MGIIDWLRRFSEPTNAESIPDGWTDDLSIQLPSGRTVEEVVDYILAANQESRQHEALIAELGAELGLSTEDAELAVDRVGGEIARAATGSPANCPNRVKDPIAWASFQRAIAKR